MTFKSNPRHWIGLYILCIALGRGPCLAADQVAAITPIPAAATASDVFPAAATASMFSESATAPIRSLPGDTDSQAPELPPAGSAPASVTVRVTGERTAEEVFIPIAESLIREQMRIASGARYLILTKGKKYVDPPRTGGVGVLIIPVKIWGQGLRTVRQDVIVRVENLRVEGFRDPSRIYVSNSPESLSHSGELLKGTLFHASASRFIIHHKNVSKGNLNFVFFVSNPNHEPAFVRVVGDILGVWDKEMIAGHDSVARFMNAEKDGVGYLLEVPPGGSATLKKFSFGPGQIVSGLCEVQVIRGHGIDFSVRVLDPFLPDQAPSREIGDFQSNRAHGYYASPRIPVKGSVGASGDLAPLHGNYGVTYDIALTVENPGPVRETVDVVFAPAGGPAMGTFFIDGVLTQTKTVKPPDKCTILTLRMEPGATRHVRLLTIPESGSYYPVRLIVGTRIKGF